jgi:hypothetical protein
MADANFKCETARWWRFLYLCDLRGVDPDFVLNDLLRLKVQNWEREKTKRDGSPDEQLLVSLRLLVAESLAESENWESLQAAMDRRGIAYYPSGGGLIVIDARTGEVHCKASEVGPGYLQIVRRFGAGMPGHPKSPHAKHARQTPASATALAKSSYSSQVPQKSLSR